MPSWYGWTENLMIDPALHIACSLPRRRRAFTLTELIVAVGAVALLTVGIGQLFSSVQRLVGNGAAVAETDQYARALVNKIETDLAALTELDASRTFFAVRCRRMGDTNRNGVLDVDERAVFLNADDREADQRDRVDPYEPNRSRAVTVRLDEMMFLGFAGGQSAYRSAQSPGPGVGVNPVASEARIYYGHGLKPALDSSFDPLNVPTGAPSNVRPRSWVPDGDFAQRIGEPNIFDTANRVNGGLVSGRNEYAGEWQLLRHHTLLYGGLASGQSDLGQPQAPFSSLVSFMPYLRELEARTRPGTWNFSASGGTYLVQLPTPTPLNPTRPQARLASYGRVDVCAQNIDDVRRWLEGLDPGVEAEASDAGAFSAGFVNNETTSQWTPGSAMTTADAPLWQRVVLPGNAAGTLRTNMRDLRSAIAGCFSRFQQDPQPPAIDRRDSLSWAADATPVAPAPNTDFPGAAFMDNHAIIGSRVSSFEIAWSYGERWTRSEPLDYDADGVADFREGDLLFYDLEFNRYNPPAAITPSLADFDLGEYTQYDSVGANAPINTSPEVPAGLRNDPVFGLNTIVSEGQPAYQASFNGADPTPLGVHEYLAVFPFRRVNSDGTYSQDPYPKPSFIRVRFTVHDALFRVPGGRRYEFVFNLNFR